MNSRLDATRRAPRPCLFFFNDPAPTEIYPLPLHDALPISDWTRDPEPPRFHLRVRTRYRSLNLPKNGGDRKSTRLNSSHLVISYAVFCLKKKKKPLLGKAMTELRGQLVTRTLRDLHQVACG